MENDSIHLKLRELLDANARFGLSARGTTNHCPMALIALAGMGASPARLQAFFDRWEREYALRAAPVDIVISRGEWSRYLGNPAAFGVLRVCFLDWITNVGPIAVVTEVLREVPFAPATQAFHGIIRLAYGIEVRHAGEIASGLASLISSHLPVDALINENRAAQSIDAGFDHVVRAMSGVDLQGSSITSRLRAVATDERFASAVLAPPPDAPLLDTLAQAAIEAYWRHADFTILHMVTATRAARIVFDELPDTLVEQLLPRLWIALCAAYVTVGGRKNGSAASPDTALDWIDVCKLAVDSNDDHVIKMAYTCLCEDRRRPSPLYLASAARLIQPRAS